MLNFIFPELDFLNACIVPQMDQMGKRFNLKPILDFLRTQKYFLLFNTHFIVSELVPIPSCNLDVCLFTKYEILRFCYVPLQLSSLLLSPGQLYISWLIDHCVSENTGFIKAPWMEADYQLRASKVMQRKTQNSGSVF